MEIMNAVIVVAVGIAIFIVMGLLNKHNQNYYKLIAFDLDGTLIDSSKDLAAAINATLDKKTDLHRLTRKRLFLFLGNGTKKTNLRCFTGKYK